MQRKIKDGQNITRDQLKEIIQVNFELFKEEPQFYDYITDLVIYLMEHEYGPENHTPTPLPENFWERKKGRPTGCDRDIDFDKDDGNDSPLPVNNNIVKRSSGGSASMFTSLSLGEKHLPSNRMVRGQIASGNTCPHCNNAIKTGSKICPFCLAMLSNS